MKLPISLLLLAALGHAATTQSAAKGLGDKGSVVKSSGAKSSAAKSLRQKDTNQTSKRELYEGNFGDRKGDLLSKYGASEPAPGIEYADDDDLKQMPEQSPAHPIFGARLPQIAKISDVLTGQAPFETAVANHLYAPVSIYQTRFSLPTSFEVPAPAASQVAYPKAYHPRKVSEDDQKPQEVQTKGAEHPKLNFNNVFVVKQPRFRFDSFPRPFSPAFPRQPASVPQDVFRQPQQFPKQAIPQLYPLFDELGPNRYPGHVVPSQYLQQQGVFQLVPVDPSYDYVNLDESRGERGYADQLSREEVKAEATERPAVQNEYQSKQGYHAHPNGAISFASFSQNLPSNTQHETAPAPPPQPEIPSQHSRIQQEIVELPSQQQPASELSIQKQNYVPVKQKLHYPVIFQEYVQQLQKSQPRFKPLPQFITVQQPIRSQPKTLNPLQQRLLFESPRHLSFPQTIQFQRLPFKVLPQSQHTSESLYQQTSTAPVDQEPASHYRPISEQKPFGYHSLSTQNPIEIDQPLAPVSPQRYLTPLPPLKPNYTPSVKPLNSYQRTAPGFLPTSLEAQPTATPTLQPVSDQLISSTTIQPDIKDKQEDKTQSIHTETQHQTQTSQPLEPEITHQSEPTPSPLSIQSTTLQPFARYETQSEHLQHSTPQPEYQSTIRPQSVQTSPRHEVIIQQQEVQELIFGPPPQSSNTPNYQKQIETQQQQQHQSHGQQIFEHLQNLQFHDMLQVLNQQKEQVSLPLQYQHDQQTHSQQHNRQQRLEPLHYQFQSEQLQSKQNEPEQLQSQQHQHSTQQIESEQPRESQNSNLEENQQASQQYEQNLEPRQNQKPHLESQNHVQVTTIQPPQKPQTQSEPHHQTESQPQQYQSEVQSTTEVLHGHQEKVPTPIEYQLSAIDAGDPYSSPILSPIQSGLAQAYGQPQQLLDHPEHSSALGGTYFPDVQYFGKYAESLFGGVQN